MLGPIVLAILATGAAPGAANAAQPIQEPLASATQVPTDKPWPPPGVLRPGAGVTAPRLIKEVRSKYTAAAIQAKIGGGIELDVVVQTDGKVGEVRVRKSLDREFGLDDEAVNAVKKWEFVPGKKDGVAVPVLVTVEMTFSLRK